MGWVILLALAMASCAPPQQFERGTYVPAPTARPGVGAPVVGQPRARVEPPRSPHKRVLPPERGPGIWAGDDSVPGHPVIDVFDVIVPAPEPSAHARDVVTTCAGKVRDGMIAGVGLERAIMALTLQRRACVVLTVMVDCLGQEMLAASRRGDEIAQADITKARLLMLEVSTRSCTNADTKDPHIADIIARWGIVAYAPPARGRPQ